MNKSTHDNTKTRKPRAKETGTLIGVRLQADLLALVDAYIANQKSDLSRPEAIRSILKDNLPK